jgi:hypothetical protein
MTLVQHNPLLFIWCGTNGQEKRETSVVKVGVAILYNFVCPVVGRTPLKSTHQHVQIRVYGVVAVKSVSEGLEKQEKSQLLQQWCLYCFAQLVACCPCYKEANKVLLILTTSPGLHVVA